MENHSNKNINPYCGSIRIRLSSHPTRSVTDKNWRTIEPIHIEKWKEAMKLMTEFSYKFDETRIIIKPDWKPIPRRLVYHHKIMLNIHSKDNITRDDLFGFKSGDIFVKFHYKVFFEDSGKSPDAAVRMASYAAEYALYDVFLIMNFASPSSFDIHRLAFIIQTELKRESDFIEPAISNFIIDEALLHSDDGRWPMAAFVSSNGI